MEKEQHLQGMSRREILEQQDISTLIELKNDMLSKLSDLESGIHLVNDVLDGNGFTRFDPGLAYDANDDTPSYREHLDDSRWAVTTIPNNIELGRE